MQMLQKNSGESVFWKLENAENKGVRGKKVFILGNAK